MDLLSRSSRSFRIGIGLALILLVGAALRLAYVQEIRSAPSFGAPAVDAGFHDYWARGIATGVWTPPDGAMDLGIDDRPYFRPPGYPYFLAMVYSASGGSYLAPRVVQSLLGLLNVVLLWRFAGRWFGAATGLVSAGIMSIYWAFIYFEGELHAPTLLIFLLLGALNALADGYAGRGRWVVCLAGGLVGLAALVRPNVVAIAAVTLLWLLWCGRRRGSVRGALIDVAVFSLGVALAIAPATFRNYLVSGEPVAISSNFGINLYIGNNDAADGLVATEIAGLGAFRTCFDWPDLVASLESRLGLEMSDADVSAWLAARGFEWAREHPGRFATLTGRKALLFWGPVEVAHNKEVHFERKHSRVLGRLPGSFAMLFALTLAGVGWLGVSWSRGTDPGDIPPEIVALPLLWIGTYFISVLPFFAAARYRVPVIPLMVPFAAHALVLLARSLRRRELRTAVFGLLAVGLLYAVTSRSLVDYQPSLARWHYDRGTDYDRVGSPLEAEEEYRRAVELRADFFEARYNLGHHLADSGRVDEAIEQWRVARRLNPEFPSVHYNMARAYRDAGDFSSALGSIARAVELRPDSWAYRTELGDMLFGTGRVDAAAEQYAAALSVRDTHVPALRNLALLLAVHPDPARRDPTRAIALAERAASLSDSSPSVLDTLSVAYASAGRLDDAIEASRRALDLAEASGHTGLAERIRQQLRSFRRDGAR